MASAHQWRCGCHLAVVDLVRVSVIVWRRPICRGPASGLKATWRAIQLLPIREGWHAFGRYRDEPTPEHAPDRRAAL